ncbi:bifunctional adenosylcobinamide kinase/adenosylcobinamide-phosphate guanylyltransferase [Propioniciclava coleopterorum]|uniref:Adenosylcobinamide kinase n=1 Tax=Propioniciclava coleopterorum TaxID=2714937 RepID=A0A6G7Y6P9_9ACTN|nr:bifunctional adenosylcobinamide kinase/adenosylcobinamide-phosphate guanylyltransferase [Propioniciclava coleopterorum]QIK72492.1 bifunctional adenosylcobinamide kinase/adenosylcobinamide-phosphate guanylyltransferase [Propioniciclava coleopterorum]
MRVLVTGGVRSGKSSYAEGLLADKGAVTYVTPGYPADPQADPEWAARVAAHKLSRPHTWTTLETLDVAEALRTVDGPVLVDCLGTWLTRQLDAEGWDAPRDHLQAVIGDRTAELAAAASGHPGPLVIVTNEVGWGVVPEHRSGRIFTDLLGWTNQAVARALDDVVLVVAGRTLHL